MTNTKPLISAVMLPAMLLADGCSGGTDELAQLAAEAARHQARQQEKLVEETRKLSDASQKLVESDAETRRELAEFQSTLQQGIQSERQTVDRQREMLDDERREIETRRHRDPLIAAALIQAATLLVAALPIVLLIYMLRTARDEPADAALGELLIQDFASERSLLLPAPITPARALGPPAPDPDGEPPRLDLFAAGIASSDPSGPTPS